MENLTDLTAVVKKYNWYHSFEFAPGVETPCVAFAKTFQENFEIATKDIDFRGKSIIDVGCRDGAMLFSIEKRGASELLGVDSDLSPALTEFLIPHFKSKVKTLRENVYNLTPEKVGKFDIVFAGGLLYHLIYPMYALRRLSSLLKPDGVLIIETAVLDAYPGMPLLLYTFGGESPYEGGSPTFFNIEALENAHLNLGLDRPKVIHRFYTSTHQVSKLFPNFPRKKKTFPWSKESEEMINITRTVTTSGISKEGMRIPDYFEGLHDMHSTGRDR